MGIWELIAGLTGNYDYKRNKKESSLESAANMVGSWLDRHNKKKGKATKAIEKV